MTTVARTFMRTHYRRIDDIKLKALWSDKVSDYELEFRLGHNMAALRNRAKKLGLQPRDRRRVKAE